MSDPTKAKKIAALEAIKLIRPNMTVGLGSGTTASYFIDELIKKTEEGLSIKAVASSHLSQKKAQAGNIPIIDINEITHIDITVDGADEVDPQKRMIKGAGGAHVREKILMASSDHIVVIIDETKKVAQLGKQKLPVEVIFFGSPVTKMRLEKLGFLGKWRMESDGTLFISDNGNLILDIEFSSHPTSMENVHNRIKQVVGVIDTGFFLDFADKVIVGKFDGTTEIL